MTDNVIQLNIMTKTPVDPQKVLQGALDANLRKVLILAWDDNGDEYFASSTPDGGDLLWLIESFKNSLLNGGFES